MDTKGHEFMGQLATNKPTLKIVDDAQAANRLRELVKDADDGFRRVVKVGLYIEWIAANLKHGQLMPWLAAHAPEVSERTIYNWRSLAKNLCEWAGLKFASLANLQVSGDKLLDCPKDELSPQLAKARDKMEQALSESSSAKQLFLFLGFKQGEINPSTGYPSAKRGRAKGEGGATREQRARHKIKLREMDLVERQHRIKNIGEACEALAEDAGLIDPEIADERAAALPQIAKLYHLLMKLEQGRGAK